MPKISIVKEGAYTLILKILGLCLTYFFILLVTNWYGTKVYGEFSFYLALIQILSIVSIFGIDILALRNISKYSAEGNWDGIMLITSNGYKVILFLSISLFLLILLFSNHFISFFYANFLDVFIVGLIIIPFSLHKFYFQCLRASNNILSFAISQFLLIYFFAIVFLLIIRNFRLAIVENQVLISYSLGVFIAFIITCSMWNNIVKRKSKKETISNSKDKNKLKMKSLMVLGVPFLLSSSMMFFANWTDQLMIKFMRGSEELGVYSAAFKISQLISLPLMAINAVTAPKFSQAYSKNKLFELKILAQESTTIIILTTVPLIFIILLFPGWILSFFGNDFVVGKIVLRIVAIGYLVSAVCGSVGYLMQMTDNQVIVQNVLLVTTGINIILNFLMIPIYGIIGAAIASLISKVIFNITLLFYVKSKLGFYTIPIN